MTAALLFLLATVLPSGSTTVTLDHDRWILAADARPPRPAGATWWWSAECAPARLASGARAECTPPRTVRVHVVDEENRPAENVRVLWATEEMLRDLPDDRLPYATTATDGTAAIAVSPPDVWLRIDGPGLATHWRRSPRGAAVARLVGQPAAMVRLRFEGEDGERVSRARAMLLPPSCDSFCAERLLLLDDSDEGVSVVAVSGSTYRIAAWSDSHAPSIITMTAAGDQDLVLPLPRGASLSARVVDGERAPVEGAELEVRYRLPGLRETIHRTTRALADGAVSLGGLPLAPIEWTISANGHGRRLREATLREAEAPLGDVALVPSRSARVRVIDGARRPVVRARVTARGSAGTRTNAEGFVTFDDLPRTDVEIGVTADGFLAASSVLRSDAGETTIQLDDGAVVRARLLRESDGLAPHGVRVRVTNAGRNTLRTIAEGGELAIGGLRPGPVRLVVSAADAQPVDTGTLTIRAGDSVDLGLLIMKTGLALRGTIAAESGEPLSGATVRALRLAGDTPSLAHVLGNWVSVTSGSDGSFTLGGLAPGAQLVTVAAPGYAERVIPNVFFDEQTRELDAGTVELAKGKRLEIVCRPAKRCGTEAAVLLAGADYPFVAIRGTLADGRATLHGVPPGEVLLRLTKSQQVLHDERLEVSAASDDTLAEIALSSARVAGVVTVAGRPARGGSLSLRKDVRSSGPPILVRQKTEGGSTIGTDVLGTFGAFATASVRDDGSFVVEDLDPGDYEVTYRTDGAATAAVRVAVANAGEQRLDLRFEGERVSGVVVNRSDEPSAARVEVVDAAGQTHRTSSGADGRFALLGIARGRVTIVATAASGRGELELDSEDAGDLVVRLDAEPRVLRVSVVEANGRPARGALVFARTPQRMLAASTDGEGEAEFRESSEAALILAAHRPGGAWTFGVTQNGAPARLILPAHPGTLIARSQGGSAAATIIGPNSFPLDQVLPMVGISTQLGRHGSLQIPGLPQGSYVVARGSLQKQVTIRADEVTIAEFRD